MKNKNERSFWQKWKAKYRLVILNSENFEERLSFKLSRIGVFLSVVFSIIILVGGTASVIALTPIREYIPGYTSSDIKRQVMTLEFLSDSLLIELEQNKRYLGNIKNIVSGMPVEKLEVDTSYKNKIKDEIVFSKNIEDSMLRVQIESEEQFNVFNKPNQQNEQVQNLLFFKPVEGMVIEGFNSEKNHYGVDIVAKDNATIKSTLDGVVMFSSWTSETGNVIAIIHANQLISVYKHNSVLLKKEGDKVRAGDYIAIIGNSGKWTSGPHLHFELWHKGEAINPQKYILF